MLEKNRLIRNDSDQRLDEGLNESFNEAHLHDGQTIGEVYKLLRPSSIKKEQAGELWANSEEADLTIDADSSQEDQRLTIEELYSRQSALRQWKKQLIDDKDRLNPDVAQLYRWRVNEDIANLNIVAASMSGDMRAFKRWNEYIYGKPDETVYKGALDWVASEAETLINDNTNQVVIDSAQKVLDLLKDKRGDKKDILPSPEVFEAVSNKYKSQGGYYEELFKGADLPSSGKVDGSKGDEILEHILKNNLKSDYIISDANEPIWGVSHQESAVERPASYNLTVERFIGLVSHEVGMHLLEKINGERSPLSLDRTDRSEFNEGPAVLAEELVFDKHSDFEKTLRWREILRRHIAIAYASGVGEDSTRSSSQVYDFVNAIDTMYQARLRPNDSYEDIKTKASDKTTKLLLRVLKGTNGVGGIRKSSTGRDVDIGGGAYLKDKVYLEGIVRTWQNLEELGQDFTDILLLFKTDFNNPRTLTRLLKLGILPETN